MGENNACQYYTSRARCSPQDPGCVVGSTSRGRRLVGLGMEIGRRLGIRGWRWVGAPREKAALNAKDGQTKC